eukprot:m.32360 g.32360  ORF g.32360 m.32360 type:complete len:1107 (+) comp8402_c0_seq2:348-3668(+)
MNDVIHLVGGDHVHTDLVQGKYKLVLRTRNQKKVPVYQKQGFQEARKLHSTPGQSSRPSASVHTLCLWCDYGNENGRFEKHRWYIGFWLDAGPIASHKDPNEHLLLYSSQVEINRNPHPSAATQWQLASNNEFASVVILDDNEAVPYYLSCNPELIINTPSVEQHCVSGVYQLDPDHTYTPKLVKKESDKVYFLRTTEGYWSLKAGVSDILVSTQNHSRLHACTTWKRPRSTHEYHFQWRKLGVSYSQKIKMDIPSFRVHTTQSNVSSRSRALDTATIPHSAQGTYIPYGSDKQYMNEDDPSWKMEYSGTSWVLHRNYFGQTQNHYCALPSSAEFPAEFPISFNWESSTPAIELKLHTAWKQRDIAFCLETRLGTRTTMHPLSGIYKCTSHVPTVESTILVHLTFEFWKDKWTKYYIELVEHVDEDQNIADSGEKVWNLGCATYDKDNRTETENIVLLKGKCTGDTPDSVLEWKPLRGRNINIKFLRVMPLCQPTLLVRLGLPQATKYLLFKADCVKNRSISYSNKQHRYRLFAQNNLWRIQKDGKDIAESYGGEGFTFARNPCLAVWENVHIVEYDMPVNDITRTCKPRCQVIAADLEHEDIAHLTGLFKPSLSDCINGSRVYINNNEKSKLYYDLATRRWIVSIYPEFGEGFLDERMLYRMYSDKPGYNSPHHCQQWYFVPRNGKMNNGKTGIEWVNPGAKAMLSSNIHSFLAPQNMQINEKEKISIVRVNDVDYLIDSGTFENHGLRLESLDEDLGWSVIRGINGLWRVENEFKKVMAFSVESFQVDPSHGVSWERVSDTLNSNSDTSTSHAVRFGNQNVNKSVFPARKSTSNMRQRSASGFRKQSASNLRQRRSTSNLRERRSPRASAWQGNGNHWIRSNAKRQRPLSRQFTPLPIMEQEFIFFSRESESSELVLRLRKVSRDLRFPAESYSLASDGYGTRLKTHIRQYRPWTRQNRKCINLVGVTQGDGNYLKEMKEFYNLALHYGIPCHLVVKKHPEFDQDYVVNSWVTKKKISVFTGRSQEGMTLVDFTPTGMRPRYAGNCIWRAATSIFEDIVTRKTVKFVRSKKAKNSFIFNNEPYSSDLVQPNMVLFAQTRSMSVS